MINTILANVGTVICFRSGNPKDEELLLPLFKPYVDEGEITNLSSFNFYIKIAAVTAEEPFSGETIVLEDKGSSDMAKKAIEASRKNNAHLYKLADSTITQAKVTKKSSQEKSSGVIPKADKESRSKSNKIKQ